MRVGPASSGADVQHRLQRADGDELVRGLVGARERVADVEALDGAVVVREVTQVEVVDGLDDVPPARAGSPPPTPCSSAQV